MSDRLALSATLSVMMMAIYVLFGTEAARAPIGPESFQITAEMVSPSGVLLPNGPTALFN